MQSRRILVALSVSALVALLSAVLLWPRLGPATATGGNSITSLDTGGDVGQHASLELDASGNPVVSYYDKTNGDLKVLHCNDANCSGGDESITSPDTGGDVGHDTSLALDASGNPVVSYIVPADGDLRVLHCNDPNCSGGDESITTPDAGGVGGFSSLALDASGFPVISYYDSANLDLKVLRCNDPNCAGGDESITSPDTAGDVGQYASLALDASGNPVVSYYDGPPHYDLKVMHCNDANCAGGDESITAPDTVADVGDYTSLALDASGNPVVSYYNHTNFDLSVLHCNDPNCAGGDESITSPDIGFQVGYFTSLALDGSGNPVVSYYDAINDDLTLLHCNDPNCAGGDESISSPDTVSFTGLGTSLALDASGYPVVSYYDGLPDYDLKVLHCGDPSCAGKPATPTPTATPSGLVGDVDCDDRINSIDAALVLQLDAGLVNSLSCQQNADTNVDGTVNAIDAALVLQYDAGLIDSLPPTLVQKVDVPHGEWYFTPSVNRVRAGTVTFNARNDGIIPHNFRLVRTDLAPDALPVDDQTFMVDEGSVDVLASSQDLNPGEVEPITLDLPPGNYVMFCNIATHYQVGLYAGFTVE